MPTATKTVSNRTAMGCLALFALPFAAVGVGMAGWASLTLFRWYDMQSWRPITAEVSAAALEEHSDEDGTSYKATGTYHYTYATESYTSSRIAIVDAGDNIGGFQRQLYNALEHARANRTPITVYVDPAEPANAIVNRELRFGLLMVQWVFAIVFGGVGIGLLVAARVGGKKLAAENARKAQYPNEPWRWRDDWASGRIPTSAGGAAYATIGFATLWNLVSLPALIFIPGEIANGNGAAAIALLFPLIGVGLAAWAARSWLRHRRFKVATLAIPPGPVAAGARLKGSVHVEAEVPVATDFRLELTCRSEQTHGTGKNRERSERLLWQKEWRVPRHQCQITAQLTTIPVDVVLPTDQPLTDTSADDDRTTVSWQLDVAGECPGPDFWARFELPVFVRAAAAATDDRAAVRPDTPFDAQTLAAHGIDYERPLSGAESWIFKRARHRRMAQWVTLISVVWSVASGALFQTDAPIVLPILFSLFGALFVSWALSLWITEYRVTLERGALKLEKRGVLGRRVVEVPLQWVRNITAKRGMQAGNKLYYDLRVETNEGTHTAASSIASYDLASALAARWVAARTSIQR